MPARVVVVHDDPDFLLDTATALRGEGYEVAEFSDSITALSALLGAERIELLITRVRFAPGKPHGISLAQMALLRRPDLKVVFTALPEFQDEARGLLFIPMPLAVPVLVQAVKRLIEHTPGSQRQRLANE